MEMRAWALVAFTTVPALALASACGEPFVHGTGGGAGDGAGSSGSVTSTGGETGSGGATGSGGTTSPPCHDADGDGVTDCDGDCDDGDKDVYPGQVEICGDDKDNDCHGGADDICKGLGTFVAIKANGGDDNNPGTREKPVATIGKALQNAKEIGGGVDVYVSAGDYPEDVTVLEGTSLYGGHDPKTWARDVAAHPTVILPKSAKGVLVGAGVTRKTEIDGFRIQAKDSQSTGGNSAYGTAISVEGGTPTIQNNEIRGPAEGPNVRSIALVLQGPSNDPKGALIAKNEIRGGDSSPGLYCAASVGLLLTGGPAAEIRSNIVVGGMCDASRGLVSLGAADGTMIVDNDIDSGLAAVDDAWGMTLIGGAPMGLVLVDANRINLKQSTADNCLAALSWCGGLDSQAAKATITNNVIFGVKGGRSTAVWLRNGALSAQSLALNSNYLDGSGKQVTAGSQSAAIVLTTNMGTSSVIGRIRNNILFGGVGYVRFGIYEDSVAGKSCRFEALENNDFFFQNPKAQDVLYRTWDGSNGGQVVSIDNVNGMAGANQNLNVDPLADATFHLGAGSPCIDAGTKEEAPAVDFEGTPRPPDMNDIGADER